MQLHGTSQVGLDPKGLQSNGGPTQTIALETGSPAIDAIPQASCTDQASPTPNRLTTDQRGMPRPDPIDGFNGPCDIGTYEFQDTFAGTPGTPTVLARASPRCPNSSELSPRRPRL